MRPRTPPRQSVAGHRRSTLAIGLLNHHLNPKRSSRPPAFNVPASRASTNDPFGRFPVDAAAETEAEVAKRWRKTRSGLWWVRTAWFFFLLTALAWAGLQIAQLSGVTLPSQTPGYLQIQGLSADTEIRYGALLIPAILGLLCMTIGRLGVSNVPRSAQTHGLTSLAAISTLLALGGAIAFLVPAITATMEGFGTVVLLTKDDPSGIIQRIGLVLLIVMLPKAELLSLAAMGRIGTALRHRTLTARASKLVILIGLAGAGLAIYYAVWVYFGYASKINTPIKEAVGPYWDKLGNNKQTALLGLCAFAALVFWMIKIRLVGAGRRAIREWQDLNAPMA